MVLYDTTAISFKVTEEVNSLNRAVESEKVSVVATSFKFRAVH